MSLRLLFYLSSSVPSGVRQAPIFICLLIIIIIVIIILIIIDVIVGGAAVERRSFFANVCNYL